MTDKAASNFLKTIVEKDIDAGLQQVVTRFPPEPNGFLHIGHAKSICLNFGLAQEYQGVTNLRFDDTNPEKEEQKYIDAIIEDVQWLGFQWNGEVRYTSDYFDQLYTWAQLLIREGKAYVCDLSPDEIREYRGTLKEPGKNSPYRERSAEESLDLLERMKNGEFPEGSRCLRAKIDMSSSNMNLRDPIMYRIRRVPHHQTGDKWNIYPSYDYAHGQGDAIEGITHSICTLEFEDHRPLYDWFVENLPVPSRPHQYEFARLNVNYTVTSKRKLKRLVDEHIVDGWDDPRMPTVSGLRRRGVPPGAIRKFADMVGTSRAGGVVDLGMLDHAIRDVLNDTAPRAMAVLDPVKLVLTNVDATTEEILEVAAHPNVDMGTRLLPFTREIFIDRADFNEDASLSRKKFKRLVLGDYVRLRSAYVIRADEVIKDDAGQIVQINASIVEGSLGANVDGVKPRGVIHWVSAEKSIPATVRLYDRLFNHERPDGPGEEFLNHINPDNLQVIENCRVEAGLLSLEPESRFQFEREGYFVIDRFDSKPDRLVFNQTIGLKDNWQAKQ